LYNILKENRKRKELDFIMIKEYHGDLGNFEYDDREFKLVGGYNFQNLVYTGTETDGSRIKIPEGITSCNSMFAFNGITIPPVIPAGVVDCNFMFQGSRITEPPLIPYSVLTCDYMFENCQHLMYAPLLPEAMIHSRHMFAGCTSLWNYSLTYSEDKLDYARAPAVIGELSLFVEKFYEERK